MASNSYYNDDDSECSICTEIFKDPVLLPCRHIFCLKCIESYTEQSHSDHNVPCPLCRSKFEIPLAGLKAFATTLKSDLLCDVCMEADEVLTASWRCLDCNQNFCEQDYKCHSRQRVSKNHKFLDIKVYSDQNKSNLYRKGTSVYCCDHLDKQTELYCIQCKTPACSKCFVERHADHKPYSTIEEAAKKCQENIQTDMELVDEYISRCFQETNEFEENKNIFIGNIEKVQQEIITKISNIVMSLNGYKQEFLKALEIIKSTELKCAQIVKQGIENRWGILESLKEDLRVLNKDTLPAAVIVDLSEQSHCQVEKQLKTITSEEAHVSLPTVSFTESSQSLADKSSIVGLIFVKKETGNTFYHPTATLSYTDIASASNLLGERLTIPPGTEESSKDLYVKISEILKKLTFQNSDIIHQTLLDLPIDSFCVEIFFETALTQPDLCTEYAQLAHRLSGLDISSDGPEEYLSFRKALINRCQNEFEKEVGKKREIDVEKLENKIQPTTFSEEKGNVLISENEVAKGRQRSLGNIRFIGQLFKFKMLSEKIMFECVKKLSKANHNDCIECLCDLIQMIGKDLDTGRKKKKVPTATLR